MTVDPAACVLCTDEPGPAIPDRVRALALDILHRLRPVCANMPDTELLELATRMASVELKYFERTAVCRPPRRHVARG
jgi:hypothetical protein